MSVVDPRVLAPSVARPHVEAPDVAIAGALVALVAVRLAAVDSVAWSWYESLRRPSWASAMPLLLGLGWFVVIVSSAVGAWVVTRRDRPSLLLAWVVHAALLVAWVWVLFWNGSLTHALGVSFLLVIAASVATAGFLRASRLAGALMVPALVWSVAALVITGGLAVLN
jgi:tryptophan-rich sensory protein